MFIKFGDKTKQVVVKKSKEDLDEEEDVIYMDDESDDRRIKALKKYDLSKKLHKTSK
jgi:hypothetical protein